MNQNCAEVVVSELQELETIKNSSDRFNEGIVFQVPKRRSTSRYIKNPLSGPSVVCIPKCEMCDSEFKVKIDLVSITTLYL